MISPLECMGQHLWEKFAGERKSGGLTRLYVYILAPRVGTWKCCWGDMKVDNRRKKVGDGG